MPNSTNPTLATIGSEGWELRSGERASEDNPDTFWIPSRTDRENLQRGAAAKLIFDIRYKLDDGQSSIGGERMWVIVLSRDQGFYYGILDNEPGVENVLNNDFNEGCTLWFCPEHIVDIGNPPSEYLVGRYPHEFAP